MTTPGRGRRPARSGSARTGSAVRVRRLLAVLTVLVVGLAATACTGDGGGSGDGGGRSSSTPGRASEPGPPSVRWQGGVTHVAGRMGPSARARVVRRVRATLSTYLDGAFLRGEYPRDNFSASLAAFTTGARARAGRDASLLTNEPLGASTRAVRATRRTAYLSVLAPGGRPAGATAAVDLVLRVDRGEQPTRRVHLRGRFLLTPRPAGGWAIFGYDLARSAGRAR